MINEWINKLIESKQTNIEMISTYLNQQKKGEYMKKMKKSNKYING